VTSTVGQPTVRSRRNPSSLRHRAYAMAAAVCRRPLRLSPLSPAPCSTAASSTAPRILSAGTVALMGKTHWAVVPAQKTQSRNAVRFSFIADGRDKWGSVPDHGHAGPGRRSAAA